MKPKPFKDFYNKRASYFDIKRADPTDVSNNASNPTAKEYYYVYVKDSIIKLAEKSGMLTKDERNDFYDQEFEFEEDTIHSRTYWIECAAHNIWCIKEADEDYLFLENEVQRIMTDLSPIFAKITKEYKDSLENQHKLNIDV